MREAGMLSDPRRLWRRPAAAELVLVIAVLSLSAAGTTDQRARWLPPAAPVIFALVQAALLLGRRRAPLAVLGATAGAGAVMIAGGLPAISSAAGVIAVASWTGMRGRQQPRPGRFGVAVLGAALALMAAMSLPGSRQHPGMPGAWTSIALTGAIVALAWVSGYAIGTRRAYVAELRERAARLEREEGERAARAVTEERLRIARELHDVIGHSIGLITVQAEAAARSARTNPGAVPGFLAVISSASRDALGEMRRVLAVLRPPDQGEDLRPQPGLEALPELAAQVETAGLPVRLVTELAALPPGMGLAVYRIVQEALTNTLKHAGPPGSVRASVLVAESHGTVIVNVLDDGSGPRADPPASAHGLAGMRERAAMYGGTLAAGRRPGGGFEVRAALPLPADTGQS